MNHPFHQHYVGSGMQANEFLPLGAGDAGTRLERVRHAARKTIAAPLLQWMSELNSGNPKRDEHLAWLREGNTALAITGQQIGLGLGPLYTLAKAASAIAWAKHLTTETGVRCVPLFWLQTEDHDFAEIASCTIANCTNPELAIGAPISLTLADELPGARVAVAQRCVPRDFSWRPLVDALAGAPFGAATIDLIQRHYKPGASLTRAFYGVLHELFAEHGLLVLDPRHETVATLAVPIIERALRQAPTIEKVLATRGAELDAAGFKAQIQTRENTSLPFLHRPDATGDRHRVPVAEAEAACEQLKDPLRFSTSALLRPIVQDTLLPAALYIGGPAEIDYFAQASALYPLFDLPPPLVSIRGRIRLLPAHVVSKLGKLGLNASDLDLDETALQRKLFAGHTDLPTPAWLEEVEARLATLSSAAKDRAELLKSIEKTRRSLRHNLERLERRYQRETMLHESTTHQRLTYVRHWLRPKGGPQERTHAFMSYAALVGADTLIAKIVASMDPLQPKLSDIAL